MKTRQGRRAAENVERNLLTEIAPLLPGFVAACDMQQMLYVTPLLVTTLEHYPEELSVQLQLVESLHRIIHLPLSCWTDTLASEDLDVQGLVDLGGGVPEGEKHEPEGFGALASPGDRRRPPNLLQPASVLGSGAHGGANREAYTRAVLRQYASCCTPLRRQRRYSYFRPQLLAEEASNGSRLFEDMCDTIVEGLLSILEVQV